MIKVCGSKSVEATRLFETIVAVAREQCSLDLRAHVCQVHKDHAKGLNAARVRVFPQARSCDDYPRMMRASRSTLQCKLTQTRVSAVAPKKKARGQTTFTKVHLVHVLELLRVTRSLPTLQLYDAVWRVASHMLSTSWKEPPAATY